MSEVLIEKAVEIPQEWWDKSQEWVKSGFNCDDDFKLLKSGVTPNSHYWDWVHKRIHFNDGAVGAAFSRGIANHSKEIPQSIYVERCGDTYLCKVNGKQNYQITIKTAGPGAITHELAWV